MVSIKPGFHTIVRIARVTRPYIYIFSADCKWRTVETAPKLRRSCQNLPDNDSIGDVTASCHFRSHPDDRGQSNQDDRMESTLNSYS